MNSSSSPPEFTEPERYELHEAPRYRFQLTRRQFGQVLGAGLLLSVPVSRAAAQRARRGHSITLAQRLHVGRDGQITVLTGKVNVGQGSRTELTQAAAEELRLPMESIRLIMADSDLVPDDGGTAGSRTTPSTVPAVRRACVATRLLLLETAAARFQTDASQLAVEGGEVKGLAAGERFSYADLAGDEEALQRRTPDDLTLTPVTAWKVMGQPAPKVNGRSIVEGSHRYPSDIRRPDMLYGRVLRPVSYGAELEKVDLGPARQLSDVVVVRDGEFVGCAAANTFLAAEALREIETTARWRRPPHPGSDTLFKDLRAKTSDRRSRRDQRGSPEEAFAKADKVLRSSYQVAYIQHAPLEPRAAVAEWNKDRLTVWTGTQQPSRVRRELARAFQMPEEKVRLIVPDTGGAFGGKHTGEAALEAARLARAAGKPVSLRWTREEEFAWAYFRPAGVIDVAGALDARQRVAAWMHINYNSGASAIESPYDVPHVHTEFKYCDQPLRSGSYRALAATANTFARESFMDELASTQGLDPLAFRLRHLGNERLRAVLQAAANRFGWKEQRDQDKASGTTGVGLACGVEKGSYVACCARVETDPAQSTYRVTDVCQAFECGAIVNPDNLTAQVEGCVLQGLGAVLREEILFRDGQIRNPSFAGYEVPRFADVPRMEIVLVNRPDLPSVGGSETPIIGIAPAVANALHHAAGIRIRSLPLRDQRWRAG